MVTKQILSTFTLLLVGSSFAFADGTTPHAHKNKSSRKPASFASSRCFGDTAPTLQQYLAKLAKGDACEDSRVPDTCEIKAVLKLSKQLKTGENLSELDMDSTDPLHVINGAINNKDDCQIPVLIKVEYQYGDCTINSVDIQRDQQDCG